MIGRNSHTLELQELSGFRKARVKRAGRWFKAVASPNVVRKGGGLEEGGEKNQDLQATAVQGGASKAWQGQCFRDFH